MIASDVLSSCVAGMCSEAAGAVVHDKKHVASSHFQQLAVVYPDPVMSTA